MPFTTTAISSTATFSTSQAFGALDLGNIATLPVLGFYIEGTDANDSLYGSGGADEIHGGKGDDYISAGNGDDILLGEDGNDFLVGGAGADQNIGGAGYDTVSYAASTAGVTVNFAFNQGSGGDAQYDTYSGIERVIGSSFNDTLISDMAAGVRFEGGAGNDGIRGGSGLDYLDGGIGNDWLEGGRGIDVLVTGAGADTIVFNMGDGPDLVTDFQPGVDHIALRTGFLGDGGPFGTFGSDYQLATGTDVAQFGGPHHAAADQLFWDTDDHQLYQIVNRHFGGVEATLLATFSNDIQLHTSDFFFI